jgi:hypothetical protein
MIYFQLQQQFRVFAVEIAPSAGKVGAIPSVGDDRAERVVSLIKHGSHIVGKILDAGVEVAPPRRHPVGGNDFSVDMQFEDPPTPGIKSGAGDFFEG